VVTICTVSLTFNNCTFCPHSCIYVFCVDLRTNSYYFPIQHWLTGLYNWDGLCLLRSTGWTFKYYSGYCLVFRGLIVEIKFRTTGLRVPVHFFITHPVLEAGGARLPMGVKVLVWRCCQGGMPLIYWRQVIYVWLIYGSNWAATRNPQVYARVSSAGKL